MIDPEITERLRCISEEERHILENGEKIDQSLYTDGADNIINSKKLLEQGKLITVRPHTRFIDFPMHSHNYIEVVYMCEGKTVHIINGAPLTLNEGELLFLSPSAAHSIKRAEMNDIAINFIILPQFFDKAVGMLGEEETPLKSFVIDCISHKNSENGYLHFKVADILPIRNLVENLIYTLISEIPNKRNVNQTTMGLLLLQLINHTDRLSVEQRTDAVLLEVLRYIEENYQNASLTQLAELMHYDVYRLSREIKRLSGRTYTELLQEKRLSQAAFLLKTAKISTADVSAAVGYENVSYFHRLFVKRFGLSPSRYRKCK